MKVTCKGDRRAHKTRCDNRGDMQDITFCFVYNSSPAEAVDGYLLLLVIHMNSKLVLLITSHVSIRHEE